MKLEPKARLVADADIKTLLSEAESHLEIYEAQTIRFADQLDPDLAINNLKQQIEKSKSPDQIAELQKQIGGLTIAKDESKRAARRACNQSYAPVREVLKRILDRADTVANELTREAQDAEREFFAAFGLPHGDTRVSARVASLRAQLNTMRGALQPTTGLPSVKSAIVEFLRAPRT